MPETRTATVEIRVDHERGCGWRKPGGLYLVGGGLAKPCGKLPIPLRTCPCCGHGIKPCRGWTWVDADALASPYVCKDEPRDRCCTRPLGHKIGMAGLLWVGGKYYETAEAFCRESDEHGVSRRISRVPNNFVSGQTWVLLAHRKTLQERCHECKGNGGTFGGKSCAACEGTGMVLTPAVFRLFQPSAVEYVTKGDETQKQLDRLAKRGITPVKVVRSQGELLDATTDKRKLFEN